MQNRMNNEILDENVQQFLIQKGKAQLQIARIAQYANKVRKIKIYINGRLADTIKEKETKSFELDAGVHKVYVKIDWCATKPLEIDLKEGERLSLELGCTVQGWKILFASFLILFNPSNYLYLKKV